MLARRSDNGEGRRRRSRRNEKRRRQSQNSSASSRRGPPFVYDYLWQCWSQHQQHQEEDDVADDDEDGNRQLRRQSHQNRGGGGGAVEWHLVEQCFDSQAVPVEEIRAAAEYSDDERDGMLLLHLVCAMDPQSALLVEAVIAANPAALATPSRRGGLTPLMVACGRNASPAIVSLLCRRDPAALNRTDPHGYGPIHWACRQDVSHEVVRLILKIDPSQAYKKAYRSVAAAAAASAEDEVAARRQSPVTALDILSQNRTQLTPSSTSSSAPNENVGSIAAEAECRCCWDENQWKKISYVLWSRHYGSILARSEHSYSTLHAALACSGSDNAKTTDGGCSRGCGCPDEVVDAAVRRYAAHVSGTRDSVGDMQGGLPLHYAIGSATSTNRNGAAASSSPSRRHVVVQLLAAFPGAASERNSEGDLPLHQAIRAGKGWHEAGVDCIYRCYPAAASILDIRTGLPPSLLAAVHGDLDTSFELLRELPEAICTYPRREECTRRLVRS